MRIGIDIDGVLNNVGLYELEHGAKFYIEQLGKHLENPNGDGSNNIFGGTKKEDDMFWSKEIYDFVKLPARDHACEIIRKLKNLGHEIYIVTARTSDLSYCDISPEKMKKIVIKWLKKYKIYYDKIVWTSKEKLSYCKENKIEVMIDDSPKHINNLNSFCKVICFDAPYNKNCEGENITRCYCWYDIYDKIINKKI